jgi:hypothetical protein
MSMRRCVCGEPNPTAGHLSHCFFCPRCNRWTSTRATHDTYCGKSKKGDREDPNKLFCIYCRDTFVVTAYHRHVRSRHANMPFVNGEFWRPEFDDPTNPTYTPVRVATAESRPVAGPSSSGRPIAVSSGVKPSTSKPSAAASATPGTSGVKAGRKVRDLMCITNYFHFFQLLNTYAHTFKSF